MTTTFDTKVVILAELLEQYGEDETFAEFIRQNDIGLPLADFLYREYVSDITSEGAHWVNHSFAELLDFLELEDSGFSSIDELDLASVQ